MLLAYLCSAARCQRRADPLLSPSPTSDAFALRSDLTYVHVAATIGPVILHLVVNLQPHPRAQFLQDKVFPELEMIKLSLRTRDAPEPIARSSNRPTDIVKLSTSNLPQLNWASVSPGPPPPPAFNVDDLLDYMSPGRTGLAATAAAGAGAGAAGAVGQQALSVVPSYQPKYTLQRPGDNNHTLFYSSSGSSSMYARPAMGQSTLSTTSTSGSSSAGGFGTQLPRYPTLDQYGASFQQGAGSVLDPMSLTESQRLALQAQAMPAPSAGPPLGPQEVEVRRRGGEGRRRRG